MGLQLGFPQSLLQVLLLGNPIPDNFLMVFQESNKILYVEAL